MTGKVIIGNIDISDLVVEESYKMDEESMYEEWKNGNGVKHRIYTDPKIHGSFDVVLSNQNNCTLSQFKTLINNATTNHVLMGVFYCTNTGSIKAVNAYCQLTNKKHTLTADGSFIDIETVEIVEK